MPNHVYSWITVHGDKDKVNEFMIKAKSGREVIDIHNFIPYPRVFELLDKKNPTSGDKNELTDIEIKELMLLLLENGNLDSSRDGFNQGGYEWCNKNWGTKWGLYETSIGKEVEYKRTKKVMYFFKTAWSPPYPFLEFLMKHYKHLNFNYGGDDEGMGFQVRIIIKKGNLIKNYDKRDGKDKQ